jgi:transposase
VAAVMRFLQPEAVEEAGGSRISEGFNALMRQKLKVGLAWAIKEALRRLWHYVCHALGWKFWKRWYFWTTHSRLEPIRQAAETIRRHIDNILIYY